MSKTERAELRQCSQMPKVTAQLLAALDEKDALIADLFAFATTTTPDDSPYIEYQERLAALKVRAEK